MSHKAYRRMQNVAAAPRDAEYLVFSKVTAALIAVEENGREDLKPLAEAVSQNRILWHALARDCADAANRLPEKTRASIISLDHYVQKISRDIVRHRASAQPLIDINRMIMDGLAGREVAMKQ